MDTFGSMELDFSSYTQQQQQQQGFNGVSLTLGLQQHGGSGVSLAFPLPPVSSHHSSLFYATTIDATMPTIVGMAPKNQDAIDAAIVGMLADPKEIMNLCNLRDDAKKMVHAIIDKFAERGLRSLAISRQVLTSKSSCFNFSVHVPKFLVNNNNKEDMNLKHLLCYCRKFLRKEIKGSQIEPRPGVITFDLQH
ncbi:hypothetical protein Ahy_B10g101754 [Arachis hypogaea]|uniref:Uncharacterized protein n=1 Tax=Arachis hypogaea TaxID=3818 RepID=A0A444X0A0_ARAHY|nr:hypothetical protein Ahy_B10g101754 [Arachis hypogaea]